MIDKQLTKHDSLRAFEGRAALALVLTGFSLLSLMPELVGAAPPWEVGVDKVVTSVRAMLYGIAFIAIVVVGFLSFRGVIPWKNAIAVYAGIILTFGADQLILWAKP